MFCTNTSLTQLIAQRDHAIDLSLIPYFFPAQHVSYRSHPEPTMISLKFLHAILYTRMTGQAAGNGIKICWISDAKNYHMCLVYWDVMHMGLVLIILGINASSRHINVQDLLAVKVAVNILSVALLTMFGRRRTVSFPRPTHAQLCNWLVVFRVGWVCVVGIATGYGLDGPGIESRCGARFSAPVQTGPGDNPASCTMGTGSFPGGKERPGRDAEPSPTSRAVVKKE